MACDRHDTTHRITIVAGTLNWMRAVPWLRGVWPDASRCGGRDNYPFSTSARQRSARSRKARKWGAVDASKRMADEPTEECLESLPGARLPASLGTPICRSPTW
jgi:hypothetical protein